MVGWVSRKDHGFVAKGLKMIPLSIYKLKISKITNFDICRLIKQYTHFWYSISYLIFSRARWGWRDCATSIVFSIVVTGLLMLMCHIGLIIKNISTDSSYNSR